ncbi:hypothetical protein [Pedobacter sp. SL55]|uniref:hypothetical protein n=1 Tax=Pedobacter sp. SL55 TaxID=2995161 RepID=UPI00226DC552|nr:hypothetical protein [Pedobacter sp. SL55]WAC41074.1 hypothetical protein OVA16_01470 [Pedobacter sp. SL55]
MRTKTQRKTKPTTSFVMVTPELQSTNDEVMKAYTKMVQKATELLTKFEMKKYRTYVEVDHTKDPQNVNYISEFVCHFWNITLTNGKDGRSYIFLNYDSNFIEKFGSNLTSQLVREAYKVTNSEYGTNGIEYALKVMFVDYDVHNYFFRLTFEGETDTISINTVERPEAA